MRRSGAWGGVKSPVLYQGKVDPEKLTPAQIELIVDAVLYPLVRKRTAFSHRSGLRTRPSRQG